MLKFVLQWQGYQEGRSQRDAWALALFFEVYVVVDVVVCL